MCFSDFLRTLQESGLNVSGNQVRWALTKGKVSRPTLDGSLSYDFQEEHVAQMSKYLSERNQEKMQKRREE
jgi:hypothetical protein